MYKRQAFDNTINSTRYPYYAYMQTYWDSVGLQTALDTTVTAVSYTHLRILVKVWPVHVALTWGLVLPTLFIRNVATGHTLTRLR